MNLFKKSDLVIPIDKIDLSFYPNQGVELSVLREDLISEQVSGNKFRKLKYNLAEAKKQNYRTLLTFGGAFSNHIAATAKAGELCGFKTIGVIRGDELGDDLEQTLQQNATLRFAYECGMEFYFVNRSLYREKNLENFSINLKERYGDFYVIPEGGTNDLAVRGCSEILSSATSIYDYIICAVGTGGTIAGLIESSLPHQTVLGFPALKGGFLNAEIKKYTKKSNWELITDYHFGGYAKINSELISFVNTFKKQQHIQLDPIYTGKMMYGLIDLIANGFFSKNTRILAIHTGGLQGISGINSRLKKSGKSTITV